MPFDRRSFVTALGAMVPASLTSSCALASDGDWPGPDTPSGQLPKLPIGMNLASIADYEPGFPFRNLMWGARPWMTRNAFGENIWNTEQAEFFEYDRDGYPLEVPLKTPGSKGIPQQVFTLLPNVRSEGRYVVLYDGEGSFDARLGTKIISEASGRVEIHMTHRAGLVEVLAIRSSKRGNHIRNIRVIAARDNPATLSEQPFLPEFLDFCRPFHALRFMDWGATNNSLEGEWASRRRPSFYTMFGTSGDAEGYFGKKPGPFTMMYSGGVAHEVIIQLSNILEIDPWICIPHGATDEYITRCAELYRQKLNPARRIYVEYSNEVWNWQFIQSQWMLRSEWAGKVLQKRGVTAFEMRDGRRQGANHPERMGAIFSRTFDLWLKQWTGPARGRVTTVAGVQAGWADASLRTLDWCHSEGFTDAISAAGYFGPPPTVYANWEAKGAALTADDVIHSMQPVLDQQGVKGSMYQIAKRAKESGMIYLNYEGGQHIQPERQQEKPYMPALGAAQMHPGMYPLYVENLRQQKRLGSQLFCAFNSIGRQGTRWGSWGSKARYDDPDATSPKLRALLDCNTKKTPSP